MNNEKPIKAYSHIFSAIAVFAFGWGSLWIGSHGLQAALNPQSGFLALSGFRQADANIDPSSIGYPASYTASVNDSQNSARTPATAISGSNTSSNTEASSSVTILFGGDIMMDRGIRKLGQQYGYDSLFASVTPMFKKADIVVANLEGPITSNPSKTLLSNGKITQLLEFTFDPETARALASAGIDNVNLANNHTLNFKAEGLAETKEYLSQAGIKFFGDPNNATSSEIAETKNDIPIAFVGYHEFSSGLAPVLDTISKLSNQGYFVVVMPHWDTEYATTSSALTRAVARQMVSAGANIIVGTHPHVIQEHSYMGNVPVFYSIGNLLFDQYFSSDVTKGNIVELKLVRAGGKTSIGSVRIYETSLANKRGVTVNPVAVDF